MRGSQLPLRLIILLAVAHLGFTAGRLTLTLQAVHLQASPLAIGVVMSLLMVVPMFVAVHIGRWADRAGFFLPALIGCVLLALAGGIAALWPTMVALGIASVLIGSGYMLSHVSVNNAIGVRSTPENRSQAFGAMAIAFSISGLLGPMLAGFAVDFGGHAVAFGMMSVFPVVSAVLLLAGPRLAHQPPSAGANRPSQQLIDLLRHRPLRTVLLVGGFVSMGWDLFIFLVPLHGVRIGLSASAIGIAVGAFGVGSFAIRLAIPRLMRAFDEWTVLRTTLSFTAACYLAVPFCDSLLTLLPLSFLLGMVLGCGQPLAMSLVHLTAPPGRSGEAVGVRSTITSISQTVLPLLFGAIGSAVGMVPVFWTAATVLASGSVFASRHKKLGSDPN